MKYDVCVFGGCALDQMFYQNDDGTYNDEPSMKVPGGKGANQAVAASRAGANTAIISKIGKDQIGKYIKENLEGNSVDISNIEMEEGIQNDCANIYINADDKDNEIKRLSGAIDSFTPDMIKKYEDILLDSKVIMCQLKVPKEVTKRANEILKTLERKSILRDQKIEKQDKKKVEGQYDMYNFKLAEIAHELDLVNLNELTPIDALNTLVRIKEKMA